MSEFYGLGYPLCLLCTVEKFKAFQCGIIIHVSSDSGLYLPELLLHASHDGDNAVNNTIGRPHAEHFSLVVKERANQCYTAIGLQGQCLSLVLQKNHGPLCCFPGNGFMLFAQNDPFGKSFLIAFIGVVEEA